MSPPADGDRPNDGDRPSEVAAALAAADDALADAVESSLAGRSDVVAADVPLALLPPVLAARERSDGRAWKIACRPGVVDALGRAFVLGTAVAEAVADGAIDLRTTERTAVARPLFATPNRIFAIAGPSGDRTVVTEADETRVGDARRAVAERFETGTPASVDMPSRSRLLSTARERLDDRFGADVAAVLSSLEYGAVGRTGVVTDRTLLVALAARHDHLFRDLRTWIEGTGRAVGGDESGEGGDDKAGGSDEGAERGVDGAGKNDRSGEGDEDEASVGIAPGQGLTAARRALVERDLIESIKVPMGPGRPKLRLRAVDDALLRARPDEVPSVLRGRFALPLADDGTVGSGSGRGDRRPVWERKRRR